MCHKYSIVDVRMRNILVFDLQKHYFCHTLPSRKGGLFVHAFKKIIINLFVNLYVFFVSIDYLLTLFILRNNIFSDPEC